MLNLEFANASMKANDSVFAAPREWVWAKSGFGVEAVYKKGYPKLRDFHFAVGWEVYYPKHTPPDPADTNWAVSLFVDCPREEDNATLSALKRQLVDAFLQSDVRRIMQSKGYGCDERFLRRSDLQMRASRTTTVFKVVRGRHHWPSPEHAISIVHADLGATVNEVLQPFAPRLTALV